MNNNKVRVITYNQSDEWDKPIIIRWVGFKDTYEVCVEVIDMSKIVSSVYSEYLQ